MKIDTITTKGPNDCHRSRVRTRHSSGQPPVVAMFAKIATVAIVATATATAQAATPGLSAPTQVTAVEYYYAPLDYYFLTSRPTEQTLLDGIVGWQRTNRSMAALSPIVHRSTSISTRTRFSMARSPFEATSATRLDSRSSLARRS